MEAATFAGPCEQEDQNQGPGLTGRKNDCHTSSKIRIEGDAWLHPALNTWPWMLLIPGLEWNWPESDLRPFPFGDLA